MESLNQSLQEAVCIDEEVFFGPITDKERKIREQFEALHRKELNVVEASKAVEDEDSQNYSAYKSFSVEESKYESFDDSLNEGMDKMPQESKPIAVRKSYDKIKSKRSGFYDSLEDVCSLISNIDKCSISCEVENESNLNSKHFVEDSLKIPSVPAANKNNFISDQVHFDDDSLAILECEATFSDSLEEVNVMESIEIEEISDIENVNVENQNVLLTVEQHSAYPQKNLFDTSVEVVCEGKKGSDATDQEESLDDRNLLYDSLSNSDFKDILTDSLDESKHIREMLKSATVNVVYDKENIMVEQNNKLFNVDQNYVQPLPNLFDTSVEIMCEKIVSPKEIFDDKNKLYDSLSNSEVKDVSKDSLEESVKSNEISKNGSERNIGDITKLEDIFLKQNALDMSVQIIYDNSSDCFERKNSYENTCNSKEKFNLSKCSQETSVEQSKIEMCTEKSSLTENTCQTLPKNYENVDADNNVLLSNSHSNEDNTVKPIISLVSDTGAGAAVNDLSDTKKETISVESCHLKLLNDDINIDKDLKFQLHIEVTVGDKKCQIASEDIKILPAIHQSAKSGNDSISATSVVNASSNSINNSKNEHVVELNNPEVNLNKKDYDVHSSIELNMASDKKSETALPSNVTLRPKSLASQTLCTKLTCSDSFNDFSLLQALDLSDISVSFLNESIIQSKDPLIPLNLYSPDESLHNFHASHFKSKNKENIPEHTQVSENENFCAKRKNASPNKMQKSKSPQSLQKCPSFKETNKKTPGTKIPIRKIDNFAVPTPVKSTKPLSSTLSAEKAKKCQHSPHSVDSSKKTPGSTPNKVPHICKVRNTIFSKVPQFVPSKKYMNVQSPVAQYIKSNSGPMKVSGNDPVLQDCMNRLMESPHHLHPAHTSGTFKSTKKKA